MAPRGRPTRLNPNATPTPVTPAPNAPTTTTVTEAQLQALINQGVAAAMAEAEASRVRNGYNSNGSGPRPAQAARECSYSEFLKCKPLDFKGTEGVLVKSNLRLALYKTMLLHGGMPMLRPLLLRSLMQLPMDSMKKMMTDKYCPRGEIKKIKTEMWNHKVKGTDVVAYSRRFQQLALMCSRMFLEEIDKIEKYIGGLPDMIHGSVKASKPKTIQEAIEFTTELMDDKTQAYAEHQEERKRKYDDLSKNNQNQQNKRQNAGQAYTAGNSDTKPYAGSKPLCSKCNYNHEVAPAKVYVVGNAGANPDNVVAGLAGYYRIFIEGLSKIAKPMTKLTQKKIKFKWGDKQEAAFQLLKQKLCSAPILALPEEAKDFIAYCVASKDGFGAMLMQREK
ncbi:putative reverse transcriptase domain-containing protein [Tanacetum coccineum]